MLRSGREADYADIVDYLLAAVEATYASITARAADVTGAERMKLLRIAIFVFYAVASKSVPSRHPTLSMDSRNELSSLRFRTSDMAKCVCAGLALTAMDRYHSHYLLKLAQIYEAEESSKRTARRNDGFWGGVSRVMQLLDARLERQLQDPNLVRHKSPDDL